MMHGTTNIKRYFTFKVRDTSFHDMWEPHHCNMGLPQAADGGDGLHIGE
jgi:hypothetical protein